MKGTALTIEKVLRMRKILDNKEVPTKGRLLWDPKTQRLIRSKE